MADESQSTLRKIARAVQDQVVLAVAAVHDHRAKAAGSHRGAPATRAAAAEATQGVAVNLNAARVTAGAAAADRMAAGDAGDVEAAANAAVVHATTTTTIESRIEVTTLTCSREQSNTVLWGGG